VELDEFVVMPNHVHGILIVAEPVLVGPHCVRPSSGSLGDAAAGARSAPLQEDVGGAPVRESQTGPPGRLARTLGSVIAGFKAAVSSRVGRSVWQRNYYEHIIRDDEGLTRIREYIATHPGQWTMDRENPHRLGADAFDQWLAGFRGAPAMEAIT